MIQRPLILICNDDGVYAPGIKALTEVMQKLGDVMVVAPDSPQSGMGHAVTISDTIKIADMSKEVNYPKYSCSGTPVDCVKIAVNKLAPRRPDLVVSGINHGSNSSINVIYSGTMSAAVEGAVMGIPSIGFSLCDYAYDADFETAKPFIHQIAENVLKSGLPKGICLNVNIPHTKEIQGIKVGRQAKAFWDEELDERQDPRGGTYFWLTGVFRVPDEGKDTDEFALANGYISVVPVQYDLTAYPFLNEIKNRLEHVGENQKG
ncbi:MAG: 5'/3'-nucleotidase SurE [Flavobacteriales bacterium]|nr:5'/3'-nucleotidase SurE [Flavobacteriales bacterium]